MLEKFSTFYKNKYYNVILNFKIYYFIFFIKLINKYKFNFTLKLNF